MGSVKGIMPFTLTWGRRFDESVAIAAIPMRAGNDPNTEGRFAARSDAEGQFAADPRNFLPSLRNDQGAGSIG